MNILQRIGRTVAKGGLAVSVWMYRRTGGRFGGSIGGTPVLLLTTTGRRTGAQRTRPVGFLPHEGGYVVCGSNAGSDSPPAWSLNLRAHPGATVEVKGTTLTVKASEVTGEEYEPLWREFTTAYPRFAGYQGKTRRHLPLFVLQPSGAP